MAEAYPDGVEQHASEPPIFILVPLNSAAKKAVEHPRNRYYRYQPNEHTYGLYLSFEDTATPFYTIGSRNDVNIYLPNQKLSKGTAEISELQASFRIVEETGAVLLCDHSQHRNTEPFAPSSSSASSLPSVTIKLRSNPRSVVVARGINPRIAFGRDKHYQFELLWQSLGLYGFDRDQSYAVGPRRASNKKYIEKERIGGGAYGSVWEVLDVTSGLPMAVKKFHNLSGKNLEFATREVENLFRINKNKAIHHNHILEIFGSASGEKNDNWGEIFMPLMTGNLKTLVERTDPSTHADIADTVLRQMLLALQCIASNKIVHRDLKPENILWKYDEDGGYHFCLGDFGLSNDPKLAITVAGTEPFMAPEVYHRQEQTTKVDIWSLFATYVWVNNTTGFRNTCSHYSAPQIHAWLNRVSKMPEYATISKMANMNPKKRPSAELQLAILDGELEYEFGAGSYPGAEDQFPDELADRLGNVTLDDSGYGQGSGDSNMTPEMPYYEPYTSALLETYPWEAGGNAGPSKRYHPPGSRDGPREHQAYVAAYDNPYGPPLQEDDGSGTVIPDTGMWTARQLTTDEDQVYQERDRKRKGKENYRG